MPKRTNKHLSNVDFHYCSGIDIDYDKVTSCYKSGCNIDGICRCGVIVNTRVTELNLPRFVLNVIDNCFHDLKKNALFVYCVDRVLRAHKVDGDGDGDGDGDDFDISTTGGYYGEEIDTVKMDLHTANKIQSDLDIIAEGIRNKNDHHAIEQALRAEYSLLIDSVKDKDWKIKKVKLSKVKPGNPDQMNKVDREFVDKYKEYPEAYSVDSVTGKKKITKFPMFLCLYDGDIYKLIDGYHRYVATMERDLKEVYVIYANK